MKHMILPILLALLMGFIFLMSAQPADDSTETSSRFCTLAAHVLLSDFEDFDTVTQNQIIEKLSFAVRKTAHFTEYALLGFLWYMWLRKRKYSPLTALAATALYAVTDELHQAFVPGRSCELRDVLVDTSGGLFGIIAGFAVLAVLHCLLHREVTEKGSWK